MAKRRKRSSAELETLFRDIVDIAQGVVVGEYLNIRTPVECKCKNGHICKPRPEHVIKGTKMCSQCSRHSPISAEASFREIMKSFGCIIIGVYVNNRTKVRCVCTAGHKCMVSPTNVARGQGPCIFCSGHSKEVSEKNFRECVEQLGGKVIGAYVRSKLSIACICSKGHACNPSPSSLHKGRAICRECAGKTHELWRTAFLKRLELLHAKAIGEFVNCSTRVLCICEQNHECWVLPSSLQQGYGICVKCAGNCPEFASSRFAKTIIELGGKQLEEYVGAITPVKCVCAKGHICVVLPIRVYSMPVLCRTCFPHHAGESKIAEALEILKLTFEREFSFFDSSRRFDYELSDLLLMIEFDGEQHFTPCFWRPTLSDVLEGQEIDYDKMCLALSYGYRVIRFDYTWATRKMRDLTSAIEVAIETLGNDHRLKLWVSSKEKYNWLTCRFDLLQFASFD